LSYRPPDLHESQRPFESNIKNKYWANKWRVYGLGLVGSLEGVVFENWEECDEIPSGAEFIAVGMDFGFTNDPTAALKVFRYNADLYLDEYVYRHGLTTPVLMATLLQVGIKRTDLIIADSAEPKTISEMQDAGFNVEGADKGADSVMASINHLQGYKVFVTRRSTNVIKELGVYTWKKDKSGNSLNEPIGHSDHSIAGWRYVALNCLMKSRSWDVY